MTWKFKNTLWSIKIKENKNEINSLLNEDNLLKNKIDISRYLQEKINKMTWSFDEESEVIWENNVFIIEDSLDSLNKDKNLYSLWYMTEWSDEYMNVFLNIKNWQIICEWNYWKDQIWHDNYKEYFKDEIKLIDEINKNNEISKLILKNNLTNLFSDLEHWLLDFYLDYFRILPLEIQLDWAEKDSNWEIDFLDDQWIEFNVDLRSNVFLDRKETLINKFIEYLYNKWISSEEQLEEKMWWNCSDYTIFRDAYFDMVTNEKQKYKIKEHYNKRTWKYDIYVYDESIINIPNKILDELDNWVIIWNNAWNYTYCIEWRRKSIYNDLKEELNEVREEIHWLINGWHIKYDWIENDFEIEL